MNNITFDDFINLVSSYNKDEVEIVTKAYEVAKRLHQGQKRESGEDYIIHPLNVAYILALMHADRDTLCAALLHDTLEDTNVIKEDIEMLFNKDVADLVDGVTKISKLNFSSKEEENNANSRKIITSITNDARIIIIKLADRLHNMRTLQYKTPFKQKENAIETMEIYVPFAGYLGGYRIKNELEDLSLQYLRPNEYNTILMQKTNYEEKNKQLLEEMVNKINYFLNDKTIPNEIKIKNKNIYSIYRRTSNGQPMESIHDLLALKVIVDNIDDCYRSLGVVHGLYKPYNEKFRDYIASPKPNMYQSIHTTLFADENKVVQAQIRTKDMDVIASYGLMAYWYINKGNARNVMQEDLHNKFQFFKSLKDIDEKFSDNQEFMIQVKSEVFSDRIYVYDNYGNVIELPKGANIVDYACKIGLDTLSHMQGVNVNNIYVPFSYVLKNRDRVSIMTNDYVNNSLLKLENLAQTGYAKKLILEHNKTTD